MIRKEFVLIIDRVARVTESPCSDALKIVLWGKYKNWHPFKFADLMLSYLKLTTGKNKHADS